MPELVKHPWQVRNAAVSSSKGPVASFLTDFGMSVEDAAHFPRVDVSGTDEITIMNHIPSVLINCLLSILSLLIEDIGTRSNYLNQIFQKFKIKKVSVN